MVCVLFFAMCIVTMSDLEKKENDVLFSYHYNNQSALALLSTSKGTLVWHLKLGDNGS